jgi:hypothetical protein
MQTGPGEQTQADAKCDTEKARNSKRQGTECAKAKPQKASTIRNAGHRSKTGQVQNDDPPQESPKENPKDPGATTPEKIRGVAAPSLRPQLL